MALRSLARTLPKWAYWAQRASETEALRDADYPWPEASPKYLGSLVQNYRRRARDGQEARPTRAYQQWFDALATTKRDVLIPALSEIGWLMEPEQYNRAGASLESFLLEVPDFNSLIAVSQMAQKPVFALTQDDIGSTGIVFETQEQSIVNFNNLYTAGAEKIIHLTNG